MNWIKDFVRPKIRSILGGKRQIPDNFWIKCPETGEMVFYRDLEVNQFVIPNSGYHMRMTPEARLLATCDDGLYEEILLPSAPVDPLKFRDERRYLDRLKEAKTKTNRADCIAAAIGCVEGTRAVVIVQDFAFMGGSLGIAAGEALIAAMDIAVVQKLPVILFASSGGARMQEGILSLMQLPRTTAGVYALNEARLPYIVVLTHPTTGGVTASYAMLGDVHLAEPSALIGFAGPRVIEQTIREKLPEGFQRAEYLEAHGMVDQVVHRHQMKATLGKLLRLLAPSGARDC